MAISKITDAARDAASVGAMADRPNSTARDGYSGLTPEQVKAKFDALPKLNTAKINEIIDALNAIINSGAGETEIVWVTELSLMSEILAALNAGKVVMLNVYNGIYMATKFYDSDYPTVYFTSCMTGSAIEEYLAAGPDGETTWTSTTRKVNVAEKIKVGGTEYNITRKALEITDNGVTTTYYVADITASS